MITEIIQYQYDGVSFKGYLARPNNTKAKLPAVLVAHTWRGQDDFSRQKAEAIAELGYVGFALDLYGNATTASDDKEALQLMLPLFLNRQLLQNRMKAGLEILQSLPFVYQETIGAIGFCFGGLSVIELLRSGAPIKGVASFHGILGNTLDKYKAAPAPFAPMMGNLLILHGEKDPHVSQSDIVSIQDEMTKANVDWQMNIYGQTYHAFTNPQADDQKSGMIYNPRTTERAWLAMTNFFTEIFCS